MSAAIALLIVAGHTGHAHPHLFVKPEAEVLISDDVVEGIRVQWEWDKWWSEDVKRECDVDKNGAFEGKEVDLIYNDFFVDIKDYNYFTSISIDGKKQRIKTIKDFGATIKNTGLVEYAFTFDLGCRYRPEAQYYIRFNDDSYYTAFDRRVVLHVPEGYSLNSKKISTYRYYGVEVRFEIVREAGGNPRGPKRRER